MAEKEYTMKQWALAYAKKGLAVFPVRAWGETKADFKSPLTVHGSNDATTDINQINQWWTKYPTANIGIATGSKSGGLIAIDLDVDEDKGIDGRETLAKWEKEHAKLPDDTWLSITGRGGYHLFYKDSSMVRNRTGLLEGIDIRGEGGYIVAPPSLHFNGRRYEWEQSPEEYELLQAPGIVFDLLNPIPENWDKQEYECPDEILDGSRTQTLVKTIASMKGKCFPNDTIKVTVRHLNETRCKPPLSDKELDSTVFPALKNLKEGTASYKAVCENGKVRQQKEPTGLSVICLEEIQEKETEWIWEPRIPKAKISIIQGAPGCSKTTLLCKIIADMTRGIPILGTGNDNPFVPLKKLNVLYQITEDDFADTIVKRLRIAGADMTRIFNIDESKEPLTFADPRIRQAIVEWKIDVAVLDPIMSYVGKDTQLNMGNSARAIMNPIIAIGQETGCTFILVAHTSKQTTADAINRLIGSIDFISSARSVMTVGKNPKCESQKALAHTKSNLGPLAKTILYSLDYDEGLVKFDGYSELTDNEIIAPAEPRKKPSFALDEAKEFLQDFLKDGYATTQEVNEAAGDAGVNKNSLYKAKDELKIRSKQYGGGRGGIYWWLMPGREVPERLRQPQNSRNQS